jgi:transposase-like protein
MISNSGESGGVAEETYEYEGPKCPYCGLQYTADEAFYYDEARYTEETCDDCGLTFDVAVYTSTTWTCSPRAAPNGETPNPGSQQ